MQSNTGAEGLFPDLIEGEATDHEGIGLSVFDDAACRFEGDP